MNINDAYENTKKLFKSKVGWIPIAWVGPSGIGKTTMAKKLAKELDKEFIYLPLRTDDILGLNIPTKNMDKIDFVPHQRLVAGFDTPCIIYLDEANRADRYSRFALMEITGERTIGGRKLHPETNIILTMNDESDDYDVNECDNSFKTRCIPIPVLSDVKSMTQYAQEAKVPLLAEFFTEYPNLLNHEMSWKFKPDPRFITWLLMIKNENVVANNKFLEIVKFALGKDYSTFFQQTTNEVEVDRIVSTNNMENFHLEL